MAAPDPWKVGAVDDLRMLDPPAAIGPIFAVELFVDADHLRVRGIADGMGRELESGAAALSSCASKLGVEWSWLPVVPGASE